MTTQLCVDWYGQLTLLHSDAEPAESPSACRFAMNASSNTEQPIQDTISICLKAKPGALVIVETHLL